MTTKRSQKRANARNAPTPSTTRTTDEWLRVDQLVPFHMRPVSRQKVRQIIAGFDPDALGVLYVSRRTSGDNIVIDGNNRVQALIEMGWLDQRVPAHVYHGLSRQREHELFVEYNENRSKPKPIDIFLNKVAAGDATAVGVLKVIEQRGLRVAQQKTHGTVMAMKHVTHVYEQTNARVLGTTLDVLTAAWGQASTSYQGDLVTGVAIIVARYDKRVNIERLARRLGTQTAEQVITQARLLKQVEGGGRDTRTGTFVARHVLNLYNSGLRMDARLTWHDRNASAYWSPELEG